MINRLEKWLRGARERRVEIMYLDNDVVDDDDESGWSVRLVSEVDEMSEEENLTFTEKGKSLETALEEALADWKG